MTPDRYLAEFDEPEEDTFACIVSLDSEKPNGFQIDVAGSNVPHPGTICRVLRLFSMFKEDQLIFSPKKSDETIVYVWRIGEIRYFIVSSREKSLTEVIPQAMRSAFQNADGWRGGF